MKSLRIGATIGFVALQLFNSIFAATIRVPGNCPSLQLAVQQAKPGDRIEVAPGTFPGTVRIAKDLSIVSPQGKTRIVSSDGEGVVILPEAKKVLLQGLTIADCKYEGIAAKGPVNLYIKNCVLTRNKTCGISLDRSKKDGAVRGRADVILENCSLTSNALIGANFSGNIPCHVEIQETNISYSVLGVRISPALALASEVIISRGRFEHNGGALSCEQSTALSLKDTVISGNGQGLAVGRSLDHPLIPMERWSGLDRADDATTATAEVSLRNVKICKSVGFGLALDGRMNLKVCLDHCNLDKNKQGAYIGTEVGYQKQVSFVRTCIRNSSDDGIEIGSPADIQLLKCKIENSGRHGIEADNWFGIPCSTATLTRLYMADTKITSSSFSALDIRTGRNFDIFLRKCAFARQRTAISCSVGYNSDIQASQPIRSYGARIILDQTDLANNSESQLRIHDPFVLMYELSGKGLFAKNMKSTQQVLSENCSVFSRNLAIDPNKFLSIPPDGSVAQVQFPLVRLTGSMHKAESNNFGAIQTVPQEYLDLASKMPLINPRPFEEGNAEIGAYFVACQSTANLITRSKAWANVGNSKMARETLERAAAFQATVQKRPFEPLNTLPEILDRDLEEARILVQKSEGNVPSTDEETSVSHLQSFQLLMRSGYHSVPLSPASSVREESTVTMAAVVVAFLGDLAKSYRAGCSSEYIENACSVLVEKNKRPLNMWFFGAESALAYRDEPIPFLSYFAAPDIAGVLDTFSAQVDSLTSGSPSNQSASLHGLLARSYGYFGLHGAETYHLELAGRYSRSGTLRQEYLWRAADMYENYWSMPDNAVRCLRMIDDSRPPAFSLNAAKLRIAAIKYRASLYQDAAKEIEDVLSSGNLSGKQKEFAYTLLAITYDKLGRFDKARSLAKVLINDKNAGNDTKARCLYLMGRFYWEDHDWREGEKCFSDLLSKYPTGPLSEAATLQIRKVGKAK